MIMKRLRCPSLCPVSSFFFAPPGTEAAAAAEERAAESAREERAAVESAEGARRGAAAAEAEAACLRRQVADLEAHTARCIAKEASGGGGENASPLPALTWAQHLRSSRRLQAYP